MRKEPSRVNSHGESFWPASRCLPLSGVCCKNVSNLAGVIYLHYAPIPFLVLRGDRFIIAFWVSRDS
jgi:hypothetical protein